jgi:hypothetical protein
MPGGYKNIKGTDGNTFSSTNQPKNRGRKKKIYTVLKEMGYSGDDIKTAMSELAWYNLTELQEVYDDDTKPIITRIAANQFFQALKTSDWSKIKDIIEQVAGKAQNNHNITGDVTINIDQDDAGL